MKLKEWFETSGLKKYELADKLGVSNGTVTNLLDGSQTWVSRGLAEQIHRVTKGQVTALDFLRPPYRHQRPPSPQDAA